MICMNIWCVWEYMLLSPAGDREVGHVSSAFFNRSVEPGSSVGEDGVPQTGPDVGFAAMKQVIDANLYNIGDEVEGRLVLGAVVG